MSRSKFTFKPHLPFMKPLRNGHRFEILFTLGVMMYANYKLNSNFLHSFQGLEKNEWEQV